MLNRPVPAALALTLLTALLLPGCASPRSASEIEWEKAQCGAIIDREAREKCVERAGRK